MPACEMCGKEGRLFRIELEGAQLNVCDQCSKHGKIIKMPVTFIKKDTIIKETKQPKPEPIDVIKEDYGSIIRKKREEAGLKQEELASRISEKTTIIQKIENEEMEPSMDIAKKLEKFLNIKLIEKFDDKGGALSTKKKTAEFTIGDLIKKR